MKTSATIREALLRELIEAGPRVVAKISGQQRGFALLFRFGNSEKLLETARSEIRLFASLDTAAAYVRDLGIASFEVDMSEHEPGRLRSARPDRAEALRQTRTRLYQQPLEFTDVESRV